MGGPPVLPSLKLVSYSAQCSPRVILLNWIQGELHDGDSLRMDRPSVLFRNLIQKLATKANDLFPPKFFFPSFLFLTQTIGSLLYTAWLLTLRSLLVHGILGKGSRNQPGTPLPGIPGVPALPTA